MTVEDIQRDALETLKSFNNAIVTIRLYPAMTPQVTNAVERGYKAVKQYLRSHGEFALSREEKKSLLCGEEIPEQVIRAISNLIIYRQLEILGLEHLVIKSGIDRNTFGQLLFMFTARVEKIKREGGGREFAVNLQLEEYFPEEYQYAPGQPEAESEADEETGQVSLVREDFLTCLYGQNQSAELVSELITVLAEPEKAAEILVAGVARILSEAQRQKSMALPPTFQAMFDTILALIETKDLRSVALHGSAELLRVLKESALAILVAQPYREGFGTLFFDTLVSQMDIAVFGNIIGMLREQVAALRQIGDEGQPQVRQLNDSLSRLLNTGKGRHFLGLEKAKNIMESGEKERQAKRVHTGLQALLQGNLSGLQNDELVMGIPATLQQMEAEGKKNEIAAVLAILRDQLRDGDEAMQARIARSLAILGENLVAAERWDLLADIIDALLAWFRKADSGDFVFEKIANILQACMAQSWQAGDTATADRIQEVFYQIRTGLLKKSPPVRALVGRVQDRGVDRAALPGLLTECLDNPTNELIGRRLIMQGLVAVRFLLDALITSNKTQDRIKIIDLLSYTGQMLPPLVLGRLSEPMPWYGKRNLIKLLAETGNEQHVSSVMPFLSHDDLRVQQEAFVCLYKISGKGRKRVLLEMVNQAPEVLKPEIIKALVPFCDEEVGIVLAALLGDQEHFTPENRDSLILNICQVLGRCPFPPAQEALQRFLLNKGKRSGRKISQEVWDAAEEALALIEAEQQSDKRIQTQVKQLRKTVQVPSKLKSEVKNITGLPEEQTVRALLSQGKVDSAKKLVLELIGRTARLRKFTQAEQLREWLIEIDPMALSEIIRTAEIIEEEKRVAIDKGHLEVWASLYDVLTMDEFSTLYHCLEHRRYDNEELIVNQGALQTSLFFINSGKVKLFYREEGSDVLVKTMIRGEILGAGAFFDASVWTISAASLGVSEISALHFENLERWKEDFPALESKLNDFCRNFERVDKFFKASDKDRRKDRRTKVSGRLTAILLNSEGKNTGVSTKGDLSDISAGGVSFFVRISKKENARLLLARSVRVFLPGSEYSGKATGYQGVIVAVRGYHVMENEYSVHVRFDTAMAYQELQRVLQFSNEEGKAGLR